MPDCNDIRLMADYNAWMNERLYACCEQLEPAGLQADRGAFFGSILGTLNHLIVADIIWLKRFASLPARHSALEPLHTIEKPQALNQIIHPQWPELKARRLQLDRIISTWSAELTEADLAHPLRYTSSDGIEAERILGSVLLHFFNHQTHHRGQATTLLNQAGLDIGRTDLIVLVPDLLSA